MQNGACAEQVTSYEILCEFLFLRKLPFWLLHATPRLVRRNHRETSTFAGQKIASPGSQVLDCHDLQQAHLSTNEWRKSILSKLDYTYSNVGVRVFRNIIGLIQQRFDHDHIVGFGMMELIVELQQKLISCQMNGPSSFTLARGSMKRALFRWTLNHNVLIDDSLRVSFSKLETDCGKVFSFNRHVISGSSWIKSKCNPWYRSVKLTKSAFKLTSAFVDKSLCSCWCLRKCDARLMDCLIIAIEYHCFPCSSCTDVANVKTSRALGKKRKLVSQLVDMHVHLPLEAKRKKEQDSVKIWKL